MSEVIEIQRTLKLISTFINHCQEVSSLNPSSRGSRYSDMLEMYLRLKENLAGYGVELAKLEIVGNGKLEVISQILKYDKELLKDHFSTLSHELDVISAEEEYVRISKKFETAELVGMNSSYIILENTQRIELQSKIDELRNALNAASWKTDEHKGRVLDKLTSLQKEFDREVSNYTRNLGRLVELGDALGEFGKGAKPAADLIKDISNSLKVFKKNNVRIGKSDDPKQIPDMRNENEDT